MNKFNAVMCGLLAFQHLSISADFWKQLRTYGWQSVPVTITSNQIRTTEIANEARGKVTFRYMIDGSEHSATDFVNERYAWGDVKLKLAEYTARHEPGEILTAYISPDHATISLGHFPRFYGPQWALSGMTFLLAALLSGWRAWKDHQGHKISNTEITG